jgi:L-rhamnose isomerase
MKYETNLREFQRFDIGTTSLVLGNHKFFTFDNETHNKPILMAGIYEIRPTNMLSNTMTIYASVFRVLLKIH